MTTSTLFPQLSQPAAARSGAFVAVALEDSLDKLLDYEVPRSPGLVDSRWPACARVPLGHAATVWPTGTSSTLKNSSDYPKIKRIFAIDDQRVLLAPLMLDLARWMSRYYVTPLGVVIETIIPSAVKENWGRTPL